MFDYNYYEENPSKAQYGLSEDTLLQLKECFDNENYDRAKQILINLHPADLADFISLVNSDQAEKIVSILENDFPVETLVSLSHTIREHIIVLFGTAKVSLMISKLEMDDLIYILEELPSNLQTELTEMLPKEIQDSVNESLNYPEYSAGRLMQKNVVSVLEYWSVGHTLDYLRKNKNLPEEFYEIYVIDQKHRPVGSIKASRLLRNPSHVSVNDLMNKDIKLINTNVDQEEVSYIFKQYELTTAPVVNKDNRLVGIIDVDEIVEVIEEEAEEDIMFMGGIKESDIHSTPWQTARYRLPWLLLNLISAFATSSVISVFDKTIEHFVVLAILMPVVASLGGNAGTQAVTVAVRSIATKELNSFNALRVVFKEFIACGINGIIISVLGALFVLVIKQDLMLSGVFAFAIIITVTLGGFIGSVIPIMLNRIGVDPATSSSVFLTGMTDIIGFMSFLLLATLILL